MKAKRILAIIGIILLLAMYACTMIFALMDSPAAKGLLMASIFGTIAVPVLLHFMIRAADYYKQRQDEAKREHEEARRALFEAAGSAAPEEPAGDETPADNEIDN